jgi:hypothetical protein
MSFPPERAFHLKTWQRTLVVVSVPDQIHPRDIQSVEELMEIF